MFRRFPIQAGLKAPPLVSQFAKVATADAGQIKRWQERYPGCNWGIACDRMLVLDVDVKGGAEGNESLMRLELAHGELPETYEQHTPTGGWHLFFSLPEGVEVPNSAGRLGPGLDVRGAGGYVVAAGSKTPDGEYTALERPIAPAPQWLIDLAGKPVERAATPAPVDLDNEVDVQRAAAYLQSCPAAVQGEGGDARTFATACWVRDFGVSEETARELMLEHYNPRCDPPWDPEHLAVKVANAFRYAANAPGVQSVAALFAPVATPLTPGRFRRARPLSEIKPPPMLVEGMIPQKAIVALGALPGRSKSEHAACLSYAIVTGASHYLGRGIATGDWAVVYLDLERLATTELRVSMYAHADARDPQDVPLAFGGGPFRLNNPDDVRALMADLLAYEKEIGRKIGLVVVDALGASIAGEDSNAAAAASTVGHALRAIRNEVQTAVLVVAHSPKSGDPTIAGSVQFDAIFDVSMFVESEDNGQTGYLRIQKDNVMALDEAERKIGWERVVVKANFDEREVRANRFVPGIPTEAPKAPGRAPRVDPTTQYAMAVLVDRTRGGKMLFADWTEAVAAACPDEDMERARLRASKVLANLMGGTTPRVTRDGPYVVPTLAAGVLPD